LAQPQTLDESGLKALLRLPADFVKLLS
jgi:hypothetical protein